MKMSRGPSLQLVLPVLVTILLLVTERLVELQASTSIEIALDGQLPEAAKESIRLTGENAQFFIGLATAEIGAVAYYLKTPVAPFPAAQKGFGRIIVATLLMCVVSLFFGHLTTVMLRNQLAQDYYAPHAAELSWCERGQYGSFLVSVVYLGIFVWNRESQRQSPAPSE